MTSKHRVKNLPPADSLQPAVCSNPVYVNTILWEMSAEQCQSLFPSELHANELEGSLVVQTSFNSEDHERAAQAIINHRNEAKIYSAQGTIETIAEMLSE